MLCKNALLHADTANTGALHKPRISRGVSDVSASDNDLKPKERAASRAYDFFRDSSNLPLFCTDQARCIATSCIAGRLFTFTLRKCRRCISSAALKKISNEWGCQSEALTIANGNGKLVDGHPSFNDRTVRHHISAYYFLLLSVALKPATSVTLMQRAMLTACHPQRCKHLKLLPPFAVKRIELSGDSPGSTTSTLSLRGRPSITVSPPLRHTDSNAEASSDSAIKSASAKRVIVIKGQVQHDATHSESPQTSFENLATPPQSTSEASSLRKSAMNNLFPAVVESAEGDTLTPITPRSKLERGSKAVSRV